jgi:hypothetical protein
MKTAKILCGNGAGMDVFFHGYFADPWQAVINFDLMAGLMLAACWVWWREADRGAALTWILVLLYWGNLILAIYLYRALSRSNGQWAVVTMGRHAPGFVAPQRASPPLLLRGLLYLAALALAVVIVYASRAAGFALFPTTGYLWGLGCFIPVLLRAARMS